MLDLFVSVSVKKSTSRSTFLSKSLISNSLFTRPLRTFQVPIFICRSLWSLVWFWFLWGLVWFWFIFVWAGLVWLFEFMFTAVFETGSRVTGSPIGTESGFLAGGPRGSEGAVSETPDRDCRLVWPPWHPISSWSLRVFGLFEFFLPLLLSLRLVGVSSWTSGSGLGFCFWSCLISNFILDD